MIGIVIFSPWKIPFVESIPIGKNILEGCDLFIGKTRTAVFQVDDSTVGETHLLNQALHRDVVLVGIKPEMSHLKEGKTDKTGGVSFLMRATGKLVDGEIRGVIFPTPLYVGIGFLCFFLQAECSFYSSVIQQDIGNTFFDVG